MTDHVSMRNLVDGNQSHRGKDARADRECNAKPRDDGQWNQGCARARGDGQLAVEVSAPKAESQILTVPNDIPAFVKSVGRL
jgi:hypothetical protein